MPTLYASADCDQGIIGERVGGSVLNRSSVDIRRAIRAGDESVMAAIKEATGHIWWYFDPDLELGDLEEEIDCFALVYGEYPHVIVVDNLINVGGPPTDKGHVAKDMVMWELQKLAKRTNSYIDVLHHVTKGENGQYVDGKRPIPKSAILDSVDKRPKFIASYFQPAAGILRVCVLKNTSGGASRADASLYVDLGWQPEREWIVG